MPGILGFTPPACQDALLEETCVSHGVCHHCNLKHEQGFALKVLSSVYLS